MSDDGLIAVNDGLWIPRSELTYRATRSGGPGGQHVNTSSTRVERVWDVGASPRGTEQQRELIRAKLANRISGEGTLLLAASEHRSQHQNKEAVTGRFADLLREALIVPKKRKKTRPPRGAAEARLRAKKQRSQVKKMRSGPIEE
ncbi:MAG TPA: alternative ribosome rescue aminoacyl-tRNA hydrolase ArfB [Longimicrobium sp.]